MNDNLLLHLVGATLREANAAAGLARSLLDDTAPTGFAEDVLRLQHLLAALAESPDKPKLAADVVASLDRRTGDYSARSSATPRRVPGGNPASAALYVTMAVLDRAIAYQGVTEKSQRLLKSIRGWLPIWANRLEQKTEARERLSSGSFKRLDPPRSTYDGLKRSLSYAQELLAKLGPLRDVNGTLYAGDYRLNADDELVDKVLERTGFGCTLFFRNIRVATTAIAAGETERALGTDAPEDVTEAVLMRGKTFQGLTTTLGKDWTIIYAPLRNEAGEVVGMVATYRELEDILG